jgi:hypothetical protein
MTPVTVFVSVPVQLSDGRALSVHGGEALQREPVINTLTQAPPAAPAAFSTRRRVVREL